ncbi:uncharacterized protein LOC131613142 [Vicia villosa]|uniref:uncharacterized protein LOC131613142 n=1 Tax=Vicia villosa TaxID=3911 RepID=UPI00273C65C0|nr:uncharacterized protein LOC131613142 [Vicia villosa]
MEWKKADRKIFRGFSTKWDVFPYGGKQGASSEIFETIFFSDFPKRIRAKDVFELFGCHGNVAEVMISPRRNKFGRRFGFARFRGVDDVRMLAVRLDNILIDGKKIHANPPRYERNNAADMTRAKQFSSTGVNKGRYHFKKGDVGGPGAGVGRSKGTRSYAETVVLGASRGNSEVLASVNYSSKPEDRARWSKACIGEVLFLRESYNIQTHFEIEGFFSIKVIPLGANLCLLEEMEEGVISDLMSEGNTWWKQWFRTIKPWQQGAVDAERVTWIRVHGVPCHAWNIDFFEALANSFGCFVNMDENYKEGKNMDIARILIRVPLCFSLAERISVAIDGEIFSLALREDAYGPFRLINKEAASKANSSSLSSSEESWSVPAGSEEGRWTSKSFGK